MPQASQNICRAYKVAFEALSEDSMPRTLACGERLRQPFSLAQGPRWAKWRHGLAGHISLAFASRCSLASASRAATLSLSLSAAVAVAALCAAAASTYRSLDITFSVKWI